MTSKKYPTVRISPEAKEQLRKLSDANDITMAKGLDRLLNITGAFTDQEIYQDEMDRVSQEPYYRESLDATISTVVDIVRSSFIAKPTKPPSAIIDASILYSFKQLGKKKLTRKEIKEAVSTMMQESKYPTTWAAVYDRWFENHSRNKSKFELDLDNRLRRLVKDKLMSNEPKSGEYSHNLTTKHWEYVEQLATGFYPQPVMGKIVSITL